MIKVPKGRENMRVVFVNIEYERGCRTLFLQNLGCTKYVRVVSRIMSLLFSSAEKGPEIVIFSWPNYREFIEVGFFPREVCPVAYPGALGWILWRTYRDFKWVWFVKILKKDWRTIYHAKNLNEIWNFRRIFSKNRMKFIVQENKAKKEDRGTYLRPNLFF